jgi:hypothetical protein
VRERVHNDRVHSALDQVDIVSRNWLKSGLVLLRGQPEGAIELPMTSVVTEPRDKLTIPWSCSPMARKKSAISSS